MPSYLTRTAAGQRVLDPNAVAALKPRTTGGRTLVLTTTLTDPEVLVSSGRPGRGNVALKTYISVAPPAPGLITDPSLITWEGPLATLTGGTASSTLSFTGRNFRSLNSNVPPVLLDNYSGTVTFTNCNFFGYGRPGTAKGIIGSTYGMRAYFVNCAFFSGNPGVTGSFPGQAIKADSFKELSIINCDFYGTGGIYLNGWVGTAGQAGDTCTIRNNRFFNIDGRICNTANSDGWGHGNIEGTDKQQVQMIQLNTCIGIPRVLIQDNLNINEAGKSRVEDIVSTFKSSGTSTSPIIINRNCFSGQYIYDYAFDPATSVYYGNNMPSNTPGWVDGRGFQSSGGGGLAGDGGGSTYLTDSAWIRFTNNTVLGMSNYGLGMAACHDCLIDGNTILRSGYVRGITTRDVQIAWKHVPLQIHDYNLGSGAAVDDGTGTSTTRVRWYNNDLTNNTYGYTAYNPLSGGAKGNDNWELFSPLRTNTGNTRVLDVTRAQEDAAYNAHLALWSNTGQAIGRTS